MKNKLLMLPVFLVLISEVWAQPLVTAQWRGPNRDGIYNETGLSASWLLKAPQLAWYSEELGSGFAAPAVTADRIYINGEINGESYLFAFGLDGKIAWKSANGKEFTGVDYANNFPGARSTPTVADGLVYTMSGLGRLGCFDAKTGAAKWAVDMVKNLGGWPNDFGYSESVVVDDKYVYCFPGGKEINMAALDRKTGKTAWTSKALGDTTSFCSAIQIQLPTRKILATFGRHYFFTIDCADGRLLGSFPLDGFKYDGEHCNSPIYADGFIYLVVEDDDGKGAIKLKISPEGRVEGEAWSNKQVKNAFGGVVKVGDRLFTTIKGNWLKAVDIKTGAVADSIKVPYGSLIYADQKFLSYGQNGEVNLMNYQQGKLVPAGKFKVDKGTKEHFSHPVVANGVLYIRHGKALMAYNIR